MRAIGWSDLVIFSEGGAANATLLNSLFKILWIIKPKNILELGSGQSSKLFSRYIQTNNENLTILEDNEKYYNLFKTEIPNNSNIHYLFSPLKTVSFDSIETKWYSIDLSSMNNDEKYDLILIDGPQGEDQYSRSGIIKYIMDIISIENFIIVFDDAERKGEKQTIQYLLKLFTKLQVKYMTFQIDGFKRQQFIVSMNNSFLSTL